VKKDLFTEWDVTKVVEIDPKTGNLTIGKEVVKESQLANLKGEVDVLRRSALWPLLTNTLRARAVYQGINKSETFEHVLVAKAMLVDLDLIESILVTIESRK
jgi:hypothetical protein